MNLAIRVVCHWCKMPLNLAIAPHEYVVMYFPKWMPFGCKGINLYSKLTYFLLKHNWTVAKRKQIKAVSCYSRLYIDQSGTSISNVPSVIQFFGDLPNKQVPSWAFTAGEGRRLLQWSTIYVLNRFEENYDEPYGILTQKSVRMWNPSAH